MDRTTLDCLNGFYAGAQGAIDITLCGTETILRDVPVAPRAVEETVAAYTGSAPLRPAQDLLRHTTLPPSSRASLFPARFGED